MTDAKTESEPAPMVLTDFTDEAHNARWYRVLDNVMGGRSTGSLAIKDGVLRFTGSLNTNGGGFASLRLPLEAGTLAGVTHVSLRVRMPDEPGLRERGPFRLMLIDDLHTLPRDHPDRRSRRINHQADLVLGAELVGQWQTVTVAMADLSPSWRGRSMPNEGPLDPARTVELGLILADGVDGAFHLEVDHIEAHRGEP